MSTTQTTREAYEAAIRADERQRIIAAIQGESDDQFVDGLGTPCTIVEDTHWIRQRVGQDPVTAIDKTSELTEAGKAYVAKLTAPTPARLPGGKRKAKRADMGVLRDAMIAHVKKHPGQGAAEIRAALKLKPSQMPVLRVLTSHAIKTKGAKRAMTYWPRVKQ